ncbi:cyclase family protein [hydrothermal vent metagenome]|uniref:Cyclase family protein n=1 Tax=hydrothermal vent metagenome TaxID=652676 RepID=A0A3B0SK74_9ZZZZ
MCDACVMNVVKNKMLSRREFFTTTAAVGAAAALGTAMAPPAMASGHKQAEDLTHDLHAGFPTYFGAPGIEMTRKFNFADNGFNLFTMDVNEHTGTHVDAPFHFSADGATVEQIPVSSLIAPLCIIDIAARAAEDADAQVTPDDIKAWIAANGDIPGNACVAMYSGWAAKVESDDFRNVKDDVMHFPGFHVEAAQMLLETGAQSIAVDTLSLDHGKSADFATHYAWLPAGRFGIENLANLDKLPAAGATIIVGAPKHRGGSGGPARIFAMV